MKMKRKKQLKGRLVILPQLHRLLLDAIGGNQCSTKNFNEKRFSLNVDETRISNFVFSHSWIGLFHFICQRKQESLHFHLCCKKDLKPLQLSIITIFIKLFILIAY